MNRNTITQLLASCLFGMLAVSQITVAADIRYVSSLSDAVVVATVQTRTETANSLTFELLVQRTLKGSQFGNGSVVTVNHTWAYKGILPTSPQTTSTQLTGIWFLSHNNLGWDVLPVAGVDGIFVHLFLPAVGEGVRHYSYEDSTAVVDKVVYEMADGLSANGGDPLFEMHLLSYMSTPATDIVLSDLLRSPSVSLRSGALAGLLMNSKPGALQSLVQMWPTISESHSQLRIIQALRDGFRDTSAASVSQLIAIAQNKDGSPKLRVAATRALRSIHTKETLPFFATLLSSSDVNEQMDAIVAISSFANGCPPQTRETVASMEDLKFKIPSAYRNQSTMANFAIGTADEHQKRPQLAAFWTDWWAKNQAALVGAK